MIIRLMEINDYKEVYNLWTSTEGMGIRSLDDSEDGIKRLLNRNPTTNFVLIMDDRIAGAILCGHDGRRGYIYHACVDKHYRGKGICRTMVEAVLHFLTCPFQSCCE